MGRRSPLLTGRLTPPLFLVFVQERHHRVVGGRSDGITATERMWTGTDKFASRMSLHNLEP